MRLNRTHLLAAVAFSLAVHVAAAAILVSPEEPMAIAGGTVSSQLVIGTAFEDSLMAGEAGEVLKPVDALEETQPVETPSVEAEAVETANAVEPVAEPAIQPATTESLQPSQDMPDAVEASPVLEALAAHSDELASVPEASEIKPAVDPEPELALPENVPVPVARPKPPQTETAQAKPQKSKAKDRVAKKPSPKPSNAGDGGKQRATNSKSSSGTATAKRNTAAGNAAVSNYPGKVASKLRRSLRYPREAKRQRIRGEVVVSFVVTGNGGVSNIRIARSSGFPVLDEAARDAVRRAAPFPSIPPNDGRSSWPFSVPLGFTR